MTLVLVGTICDMLKRQPFKMKLGSINEPADDEKNQLIIAEARKVEKDPIYLQVLVSFSLYTNAMKIFTIAKNPDQLECIHFIRFMSMAWYKQKRLDMNQSQNKQTKKLKNASFFLNLGWF